MNEKILRLSRDIQEILDKEDLTINERQLLNKFTFEISDLSFDSKKSENND